MPPENAGSLEHLPRPPVGKPAAHLSTRDMTAHRPG